MKDYSDLGLTDKLKPINSIAGEESKFQNALAVNLDQEHTPYLHRTSVLNRGGTVRTGLGALIDFRDSTDGTSLITYTPSTGQITLNGPITSNGTTNIPNQGTIGTANITLGTIQTLVNPNTGTIGTLNTALGTATNFRITGTSVFAGSVTMGTNLAMGSALITQVNNVGGNSGTFYFSNAGRLEVDNHFDPNGAGNLNFGGADRYWLDINHKTLVDRGCLAWCDVGVELQNGSLVSDCEALKYIQKDPTKLTVYGEPMLKYDTLPKIVYRPAKDRDTGELYPRNKNGEPYHIEDGIKKPAADGADINALISIMIGAVKEIDTRLMKLEKGAII